MKKLMFITVLAVAALPAFAQHAGHGAMTKSTATAATEPADGEVRRIDRERGTVLLKHGEIKNLMGPMTMSFKLKDPAMANPLKEGDKVRFTVEQKGDDLIITSIRKAP